MQSLRGDVIKQYNAQAKTITEKSEEHNQATYLSLYTFQTQVDRPLIFEANLALVDLKPLTTKVYVTEGYTALLDAVGQAISDLSQFDRFGSDDSFILIVITDGEENRSSKYNRSEIANLIRDKTRSDRWSFVFSVPPGYTKVIKEFGVPAGNVQEWDADAKGLEETNQKISAGLDNYFRGRSAGLRSTNAFFTT
jgi:hypothetical protein